MSDQIHIYYPRGYRVLRHGQMPVENENENISTSREGHVVVYSNGDKMVDELYRRFRASEDTATWRYIHDVLKCAKRLIPHPTSFFFFQAQNHRLHGHGFDFLTDVMQFIETGHASMQPMTAFELIEDHPERDNAIDGSRKVRALTVPKQHGDSLATWVSHRDGLIHLVETLYVFFGSARIEKVEKLPLRSLSERKLTSGWMKTIE